MDKLAAALTIKPLKGEQRKKVKEKVQAGDIMPTASNPAKASPSPPIFWKHAMRVRRARTRNGQYYDGEQSRNFIRSDSKWKPWQRETR